MGRFKVAIDDLAAHGRQVATMVDDVNSWMRLVQLDVAATAMPGSKSAAASCKKQGDFMDSVASFTAALKEYPEGIEFCAASYRAAEDNAIDIMEDFWKE